MKRLLHLARNPKGQTSNVSPQIKDEDQSDLPLRDTSLSTIFQPFSYPTVKPSSDAPVTAIFNCSKITIGAGVAIFHLATSRVVVCRHSVEKWWFLPKGRRDAGEETGPAAEREGYEESGYRNRLLPIPLRHCQPRAYNVSHTAHFPFVTEPIWTEMVPQKRGCQYVLFWYVAETVPRQVEESLNAAEKNMATSDNATPYQNPPKYPQGTTLADRVQLDSENFVPLHHPNTGVDAEEALYESYLLPIKEAAEKLRGTVMEDVVISGWEAICLRHAMEQSTSTSNVHLPS